MSFPFLRSEKSQGIWKSYKHTTLGWEKYVTHINKNNSLKIIAWVELDVSIENLLARAKVNIHTRRNELRKRLTWLTSDVQIMNTKKYDNEITGMEVYIA